MLKLDNQILFAQIGAKCTDENHAAFYFEFPLLNYFQQTKLIGNLHYCVALQNNNIIASKSFKNNNEFKINQIPPVSEIHFNNFYHQDLTYVSTTGQVVGNTTDEVLKFRNDVKFALPKIGVYATDNVVFSTKTDLLYQSQNPILSIHSLDNCLVVITENKLTVIRKDDDYRINDYNFPTHNIVKIISVKNYFVILNAPDHTVDLLKITEKHTHTYRNLVPTLSVVDIQTDCFTQQVFFVDAVTKYLFRFEDDFSVKNCLCALNSDNPCFICPFTVVNGYLYYFRYQKNQIIKLDKKLS